MDERCHQLRGEESFAYGLVADISAGPVLMNDEFVNVGNSPLFVYELPDLYLIQRKGPSKKN